MHIFTLLLLQYGFQKLNIPCLAGGMQSILEVELGMLTRYGCNGNIWDKWKYAL